MDFLKVLVIISFVIATILTLKFHPEMHHPLIIEDEHFKLTRISDNLPKNIPTSKTINIKNTQTIPKQTETNIEQPIIQTVQQPIQQSQTKYPSTENIQPAQKEQNPTDNTNPQLDQSQIELLQKLLNEVEKEYNAQTTQQQQTNTTPKNSNFQNPYMTEQEDIIAWNKWRSNLQNQIMKDSNIDYAPLGTMFSFNFVVDKFGNVSNIKVDCSNPNYMYIARDNVKGAISRLQNKPILNFPKGSQRKSTVVQGYFFMGLEDRYSTPNNFPDFERIRY